MSLLDRVRILPTLPPEGSARWRRWRTVVQGALASGVPWLTCMLLAVVAAIGSPGGGLASAMAVGSAGWLLGSGAGICAGSVPISLVPLGLWAICLWWTRARLRAAVAGLHADTSSGSWPTARSRVLLPQVALGYAAPVALASLLSLAGPARPTITGVLTAFSVPIAALVIEAARDLHHGDGLVVPDAWHGRVPLWARRALRPGAEAAAVLVGMGLVVVVVALLVRYDVVFGLHAALAPGVLGGAALTLGQLLYLPDLSVWALSWIAGPGLQVAAGSTVTVTGAAPGLVPMVPVFGALPTEGVYPRWVSFVLLLPVLVGVALGWRSSSQWTRLAAMREKARTALAAAVVATVVVAVLATLGSGSVGVDRLSHLGVPVLALAGAVFGELMMGAGLVLVVELIRCRFGR